MTTPAALLSSSSVETTFLASTEASTTARDIHTGDEHGDSTNVVDNLEALNEDCICDYDLPTESRFEYVELYSESLNICDFFSARCYASAAYVVTQCLFVCLSVCMSRSLIL